MLTTQKKHLVNREREGERDREASSNGVIVNVKGVLYLKNYQHIFTHHVWYFHWVFNI